MNVLAHAHSPQNHRAFGFGKRTGYFTQGLRWDATNGLHRFGAVALDVFFESLIVACAFSNKVLVSQSFFNHHMDERIEHGDIGIGLELQGSPCVFTQIGNTRIRQNDFCAFLGSVLHPRGSHGVVRRRVGSDHKDQIGMLDVVDLVTHRARAHAFKQGRYARGVAQASAMVYVVRTESSSYQFLEQIGFFVATFGRAKTGQGFRAKLISQLSEITRCKPHRLFPRRFTENFRPVCGIAV